MNTTWLIGSREFTERLRSRAFLISNGAIIAILVLALALPLLFGGDDATSVGTVGPEAAVVGQFAAGQQDAFGVTVELVALADREAAEEALRDGTVDVVLLGAATALADGSVGPAIEALLASASNAIGVDTALAEAGLTPQERAALFAIEPLTIEQLDVAGGVSLFDPAVGVVFGAVFVLYGLLALFGQWVAQGIVEEKQSRVVEVLLGSVRPTQLLAGKVMGLGALGLAQTLLLAGIAAGGLMITDVIQLPRTAWIALSLVIPWYVLGFLLYATLFAMAGAVVSRVEDMQSAVMPVIVVLVLALFAAQLALSDPSGTIATVAGLVPLTAPIVQPVLFALGAATWWEALLAIVLAIAAIAVMLPVSARIYRGGILHTRGRVSYRDAWDRPRRSG